MISKASSKHSIIFKLVKTRAVQSPVETQVRAEKKADKLSSVCHNRRLQPQEEAELHISFLLL